MNNKANRKFFTTWQGMRSLGIGLMIGGFICEWAGWMIHYIIWLLGTPALVAGIIIYFVGALGSASETDILDEVKERKEKLDFSELEHDRKLQMRVPKHEEIFEFEGFAFPEGVLVKKMKNGTPISSEYTRSVMRLLTDAFYVKTVTFSLTEDRETVETHDILFSSVEDIAMESDEMTVPCGKETVHISLSHLTITYDDGKKLFLICHDDAYSEELIQKLKRFAHLEL